MTQGKRAQAARHEPLVIGWREYIALPELGLDRLHAKIDTGARTSSLHAVQLEPFSRNSEDWVRFQIPHHTGLKAHDCEARLIGEREVKNTSGTPEKRLVIETLLVIDRRRWHIEVTLADRATMAMPIILGRAAIRRHRLLVDPGRSNLAGEPRMTAKKRKRHAKIGRPGPCNPKGQATKIAMLTRNPKLYSHERLKEAAEARAHELDFINTLRCNISIASRRPEIYYNGSLLPKYDAVIPRIGASITFYGLAVLRQFEMMGVYPLNESVAIGRSRDKLRSTQILARDGIGLPVTTFAHDPKQTEEVLKLAGGAPLVIKLLEGTQGIGVVLADTDRSAKS